MEKVLADSNIFLDYYLDRKDHLLPLGEFAFQFVKKAVECKYLVLLCDLIMEELETAMRLKQEQIKELVLSELREKQKILFIEHDLELALNAKRIATERNLPVNDCMFALMAKTNNAIVVSRDRHFEKENSLML